MESRQLDERVNYLARVNKDGSGRQRISSLAVIDKQGVSPDGEWVVAAAAEEVLSELDNARLRAAILLQLVEVRQSRARIVAAQAAERHRIERNLHDGAQQRLGS